MPGPKILLVEDDRRLAALVREYLEANGYQVSIEERGDVAEGRILSEEPDLVILDLMLPGLDGLEVCRRVRRSYRGPILILTAKGDETDEIVGIEVGADDYLAKPVRPRLLLARVGALLRRAAWNAGQKGGQRPEPVLVGRLLVDPASRTASYDGRALDLTTAEFDLLWYLAARAGQVVSREEIYRNLRGIDYDGLDRYMDLRVARLRRKLGDDAKQPRLIKTVRGVGYLLVADP